MAKESNLRERIKSNKRLRTIKCWDFWKNRKVMKEVPVEYKNMTLSNERLTVCLNRLNAISIKNDFSNDNI